MSDLHGRDNRTKARAVIDADGSTRFADCTRIWGHGCRTTAPIPTLSGSRTLTTNYAIPVASLRVLGIMTNTPAVDAYWGGRPEANYVMERLMDHIATISGLTVWKSSPQPDPGRPDPHTMVCGGTVDGEMPELMEEALARADQEGFVARKAESAARGKLRGFGFGMYLEQCGGGTDGGVDVSFRKDGTILVLAAQQDNGQGHRTTLTQILSDRLGYDADKIEILPG